MLQEYVKSYQKQGNELKDILDKLEQYGRRWSIRIDGVPMAKNETSNNFLQNVKSIIEKSNSEIPNAAMDRIHRTGKMETDKSSGVNYCNYSVVNYSVYDLLP